MDKNEAKIILQAYRTNGADAAEPHFSEALALAQQDAELKAWFEEQQAFDRVVTAKLRSAPVPEDLRASILAGRKVIPAPAVWRRRTALFAAVAAVLAALMIPWMLESQGKPSFGSFQSDSVAFLDTLNHLDMTSKDVESIRAWLAGNGGNKQFELLPKLAKKPGLGCRVIDWKGNKVTLICFNTSHDGKFSEVHMLVLDSKAVKNPPPDGQPEFAHKGNWETASWSKDGLSYFLAGPANEHAVFASLF